MSKKLVAYFSASGVTKTVAENLARVAGADLYEIEPEVPYTAADLNWNDRSSRSTVEMEDHNSRPAIKDTDAHAADYDVIYVGFPCGGTSRPPSSTRSWRSMTSLARPSYCSPPRAAAASDRRSGICRAAWQQIPPSWKAKCSAVAPLMQTFKLWQRWHNTPFNDKHTMEKLIRQAMEADEWKAGKGICATCSRPIARTQDVI